MKTYGDIQYKQYSSAGKDFSQAALLRPSRAALAAFDRPREEHFPNAPFWWPLACTRFHGCKVFSLREGIARAEAAFLCDNIFDLWLNGRQFAHKTRHLELTDITQLLTAGENNLHIRAWQSGEDERIMSAITGGIRVFYRDGSREEIFLDENARILQLVNFYDSQEDPAGFETMVSDFYPYVPKTPGVYDLHPQALRRSFYFVRPFRLDRMPVKATLEASALGCYEPFLNENRLGDGRLMPFGTNYRKEFQVYDLLPQLRLGENVLGFLTGNGSYNCYSWGTLTAHTPGIVARMTLEFADGCRETLVSDGSWLCAPSPLVDNDLQYGERYDARLEIPHWCRPGCSAEGFYPVAAEENTQLKTLLEQTYPPIRAVAEHRPRRKGQLRPGVPLFDTGLCIAGRARVAFRNLRPGQKLRIRYCERLGKDGQPQLKAYSPVFYPGDAAPGGPAEYFVRNMDVYIAKGADREEYECRFAYTGFQYIWIEGLVSEEQLEAVTALELHTDLTPTGWVDTDSEAVRRIFNATRRSWYNNIFHGPTDCPTREKNFWNGDSQIFAQTACFLSDCSDFLARWTHNGIKMEPGPYGWEDETYEIPYTLYRFYGDVEILRATYPEMEKLVEKRREFPEMILPENPCAPYCDWLSPAGVSPDKQFFSGCYYIRMLDRVGQIAGILGHARRAEELARMAQTAREEFNRRHLCPGGMDYDAHNQCGIVLPVAFGIAPKECRRALVKTLVDYIVREDYHVSTGFIGTRYLPEVLADYGYGDVVYRLLTQTGAPSWMDMLKNGLTSICESWYGLDEPDGGISMAHFSLGAITEWFFAYLGGIRVEESAPGLGKVVLRPHPVKEMGRFEAHYRTQLGELVTSWHFEGEKPVFRYRAPRGMQVEVRLGDEVC